MLQLFFQQRREGGGLNFVMSQISFLWLLLPALLPRLPYARTLDFSFYFYSLLFSVFFFFLLKIFSFSLLGYNISARSASSPGFAGGGESSWLSTWPGPLSPAAHPRRAGLRRAPPPSHGRAGVSEPGLMLWSCPPTSQHPAREPLN